MELGEHAGFIIAGYLVSFGVMVALILLSLAQSHRVRSRLAELEARGVRRRSERGKAGAPPATAEGTKA
jgi:heme exporter protein D